MLARTAAMKEQLLVDAAGLERLAARRTASRRRSILFERRTLVAAHTMRQLCEAGRLSSGFEERFLACVAYPATSDIISRINSHRFRELYDLATGQPGRITVRHLLNVILEGFLFAEAVGDDPGISGFYLTSERRRHDRLWYIAIDDFTAIMRAAAHDRPSQSLRFWNAGIDDWEVWQGDGPPPSDVLKRRKSALVLVAGAGAC